LIALISFRNKSTGQCNPGFDTLRKRLGLAEPKSDRRKLYRWLAQLREAGVITSRKRRWGGVVWYEFPFLQRCHEMSPLKVTRNVTFGASHPLYEQTEGNRQARGRAAFPPKKPIQSAVLERYQAQQQRKAGR
jgi:hypothetical protein